MGSYRMLYVFSIIAIMLYGCGGGGEGGIDGTGLQGTVAVGSPIKNSKVFIKGQRGRIKETLTDENGKYSVNVDELIQPYLLKTETVSHGALYGLALAQGVANIHPLSDLVSRNFFGREGKDIDVEFSSAAPLQVTPTAPTINSISETLEKLLSAAYEEYTVPNNFNFLTSQFDANQTEFDALLDQLRISIQSDVVTVNLIDQSTNITANVVLNLNINADITQEDTESPTKPSSIMAIAASDSSITTVWNSSTDNIGVAGYNIYRDGSDAILASVAVPVFSDIDLDASTEHCYIIEAFDGEGNQSEKSDSKCGTTLAENDTVAPSAVTELEVTAAGSTKVSLTWMAAPEDDVLGYHVYRKSGDQFDKISTVIASGFEDAKLDAATEYCYQIKTFDAALNLSQPSASQCATTEALEVTVDEVPPTTSINVAGGTYESMQSIMLSCNDDAGSGCKNIHFTLDDTDPTINSETYSSAITISSDLTLKYFSVDNFDNYEAIKTEEYVINLPVDVIAPQVLASPAGGLYAESKNIDLTCSDDGGAGCKSIHYTLDGADPTLESNVYSSLLVIDADATLKFFAVDNVGNESDIVVEEYLIDSADSFSVTVNSNDSLGVVTSDIGGISCGDICSVVIGLDSQVIFTASHPSDKFVIWTGCAVLDANRCSVDVVTDTVIQATFVDTIAETEPNNFPSDAELIETSAKVQGFFNTGDDEDYFKLEVTEAGSFYASISHSQISSYLYLYEEFGTSAITSSGLGTAHTLNYSLTPGIYYLKVMSWGATFDLDNPYNLELSGTVLGGLTPDQYEENNFFSTATVVRDVGSYNAYFDSQNDDDYFAFDVAEAGTFSVTVSHNTINSYIYLYDDTHTRIVNTNYAKAQALTQSLTPGTYFVRVFSLNNAYDLDSPYNIEFAGTVLGGTTSDSQEENDSFDTATAVTAVQTLTAYFDTWNDEDYYRFDVAEAGTFRVTVSHNTVNSYIYLYDDTRSKIVNTNYAKAQALTQSLTAGTYYVRVFSLNNAYDLDSPYNIEFAGTVLGGTTPDSQEENDSFDTATAITSMQTLSSYFDTWNDEDYYSFEVAEAGTFTVSVSHNTVNSYIYLYDDTRAKIVNTNYAKAQTLSQSLTAGTYYVRVFSLNNAYDLDSPYSIEFAGTVLGGTTPDSQEENNFFDTATAVTAVQTLTSYFDTWNDEDYYRFEVAEAGTFSVTVSHNTVNSYIYLYDEFQARITNTNYAKAQTLSQSLTAGTYYVRVFSLNNAYDLDSPYSIEFAGTVLGGTTPDSQEANDLFDTATMVTGAQTLSAYFDTWNDEDYYRIEVTTDGTLNIALSHNTVNSYIYLYDEFQVRIANTNYGKAQSLTQSLTTGTYYVRVFSLSNAYDLDSPYSIEFSGDVLGPQVAPITITGTITLPDSVTSQDYFVGVDDDLNGDNGLIGFTQGAVTGNQITYTIELNQSDNFYIFASVNLSGTELGPWATGDYVGDACGDRTQGSACTQSVQDNGVFDFSLHLF